MSSQPSPTSLQVDREAIYHWILDLINPATRENALLQLRYKFLFFSHFQKNIMILLSIW